VASAEDLERLYSLPLEDFTDERNALVRSLRQEGKPDEAEAVKALRKPSVAVWATNQLAREHPDDVRALTAAAERLAGGDQDANAAFRSAFDALVRAAPDVLSATGRKPTDAVLDTVGSILRAAAADADAREDLVHGRLAGEPEATGFEAMRGAAAGPRRARAKEPKRREGDQRRGRRVQEARAALSDARAHARDLRRRADAAEREARRARQDAERAEAEISRAEERLEAARRA
jgi:hypothetical protein